MTASEGDFMMFPLRECAPWCEKGDGHPTEHPEDRSCWSEFQIVPLSKHKPEKAWSGEGSEVWRMAYLNVYLRRWPDSDETQLWVHSEENDYEIRMSLGEAASLRDQLTALLEKAGA